MRRLYAFTNRNQPLPVQTYDDHIDDVRVVRNENRTIVRKSTNNVVENNYSTNVKYVETDNVYLNETARCPYCRFPWWVWLLFALGLLALLGLTLGLGLGLGLQKSSTSTSTVVRCGSTTCPPNSACVNNRCECNTGYFYDYTVSSCATLRHVGMTCTTGSPNTQCIANANCASNGYCICNSGYFLDQVSCHETRTTSSFPLRPPSV